MMNTKHHHFTIGSIECHAVSDQEKLAAPPPSMICVNAPESEMKQILLEHHLDSGLPIDYVSLLIKIDGHQILVDPGSGPDRNASQFGGKLNERLQEIDIQAEDIDIVILTHAHADHISGTLTEEGKVAYPNARHVMSKLEWEFWSTHPDLAELQIDESSRNYMNEVAQRHLSALSNRLKLVEDGEEIAPGIKAVIAPGHTPGHLAITISSGNEQLLHIGDLVYHPIQIERPDWYSIFDYSPEQLIATRNDLFNMAAREKTLILAYHIPLPGLGHVVSKEQGFQWQPL